MLTRFTVAEEKNESLPEADVSYVADDKGLDGPDKLDAGPTTFSFANESQISREIDLIKLKRGKALADLAKLMEAAEGPPNPKTAPIDFFAFVFSGRGTRFMDVDLTPGRWIIGLQDPEHPSAKPPGEDPFAKVVVLK